MVNNIDKNTKVNKMELNKISTAIISILITLAISFGSFCYRTGIVNNELKNIKENQVSIKKDLKDEISKIENKKAEKDIVQLIFLTIDKIDNKIENINTKLDNLIMDKEKEKK